MLTIPTKKTYPRSPSASLSYTDGEHLRWVQDRIAHKQSVKFQAFVIRFHYYDQTSARRAYDSLLDSDQIPGSRLALMQKEYAFFTDNIEGLFWSKRQLDLSTKITSLKAAVFLQEAALKQVQLYTQRAMEDHKKSNKQKLDNNADGYEGDDGGDPYGSDDGSENWTDDDQVEEKNHKESNHGQDQHDEDDGDQDEY
ncbi:hypothetical protein CPB97_011459 [Podila verticillata]|nr:hypothetical protein CPB97_011459 [Podila verticillata]